MLIFDSHFVFGWMHQFRESMDYLNWKYHNHPTRTYEIKHTPAEAVQFGYFEDVSRQVFSMPLPDGFRPGRDVV